MDFEELIEPLRLLFKDEVRQMGIELGLPDTLVWRQLIYNSTRNLIKHIIRYSSPISSHKISCSYTTQSDCIIKVDYLVQGTIYPDVIESGLGDSAVIKSHHNVGGLPDVVDFEELIEPYL